MEGLLQGIWVVNSIMIAMVLGSILQRFFSGKW